MIRRLPGRGDVLELGADLTCIFGNQLIEHGFNVTAVNPAKNFSPVGRIEALSADARELPFTEGKFDCIVSINAVQCMINLPQILMESYRVLKPGGLLIYDPNGITHHPTRKDINIYSVEAADEAAKLGMMKVFNMIVLGGFLKLKPLIQPEFIHKGLEKSLPARHHKLIPENEKAIEIGKEILKAVHVL